MITKIPQKRYKYEPLSKTENQKQSDEISVISVIIISHCQQKKSLQNIM